MPKLLYCDKCVVITTRRLQVTHHLFSSLLTLTAVVFGCSEFRQLLINSPLSIIELEESKNYARIRLRVEFTIDGWMPGGDLLVVNNAQITVLPATIIKAKSYQNESRTIPFTGGMLLIDRSMTSSNKQEKKDRVAFKENVGPRFNRSEVFQHLH